MDEIEDKEQAIFTENLIEETRWLLNLPEPQRTEYVRDMINGLSKSIKQITNHQGGMAEKLALINGFIQELDEKATVLIPPITYAVKPEFQEVFRSFINQMLPG